MKSSVHQQVSGLDVMESGLKTLKKCKLMNQPQFKDMFWAIERHHRDLKLAHLTGKAVDLIEHGKKDTKFFNILTKMLCEVKERQAQEQRESLKNVYLWYQANKHKLYNGPHFGKAYKQEQADILLRRSAGSRKSTTPRSKVTQVIDGERVSTSHSGNRQGREDLGLNLGSPGDFPSPRFSEHIGQLGRVHSDAGTGTDQLGSTIAGSGQFSGGPSVQERPTESASHPHQSVASVRATGLKRMVHPIISRINPLATVTLEEEEKVEQKQATAGRPKTALERGVEGKSKEAILEDWNRYVQSLADSQNSYSKMKFFGRSGTPLDVRYTAHERGEMPEEYTPQVVSHLISFDPANRYGPPNYESKFMKQSLEEFYQSTGNFYPSQRRGNRTRPPQSAPTRRLTNRKSLTPHSVSTSDSQKTASGNIRMNTVVKFIDSVTDGMTHYKEKLVPEPAVGFRQPTVSGLPLSPRCSSPPRELPPKTPPTTTTPLEVASPRARANTPDMEIGAGEGILMEEDQENAMGSRVTQPRCMTAGAIDWRGQITPGGTRYKWVKTRFGGHTYVKKMRKQSGRSAGGTATPVGRPRTAPVSMRSLQQEEGDTKSKSQGKGTHHTTSIDQKDVDSMMTVQHLLGSSGGVERFYPVTYKTTKLHDSFENLFDEDFLHYRKVRQVKTPVPQQMEYVSFVKSATTSIQGSRAQSGKSALQASRDLRFDSQLLEQLTELNKERVQETELHLDLSDTDGLSEGAEAPDIADLDSELPEAVQESGEYFAKEPDSYGFEQADVGPTTSSEVLLAREEAGREEEEEDEERGLLDEGATPRSPRKQAASREGAGDGQVDEQDEVYVEVTAIPSGGRGPLPASARQVPLQELTASDLWHFSTEEEDRAAPVSKPPVSAPPVPKKGPKKSHLHHVNIAHSGLRSDPTMSGVRVERSAGRMPGRSHSASVQLLRMTRRHNEAFQRAPPLRTPPSIPTPYNSLGGRSPRSGQVYSAELDHHARTERSPRHFMEIVKGLRNNSDPRSAPPLHQPSEQLLSESLQVQSLHKLGRSHTMPSFHGQTEASDLEMIQAPTLDMDGPSRLVPITQTDIPEEGEVVEPVHKPATAPAHYRETDRNGNAYTANGDSKGVPLSRRGRPIPHYSHVPDPDQVAKAVQLQKEVSAAVDIQRIFRGYVARGVYEQLKSEVREAAEDKQRAAIEIQRRYRGHVSRKNAIYKREPNPETMEWARSYRDILVQKSRERAVKAEIRNRENALNYMSHSSKVQVIGPHVEIYDIYHPKRTGPSKRELHEAATVIQRHIRGWLVRRKMDRLARKATWQGSSFSKMVKEYRTTLIRVQQQHGKDKISAPFSVKEMSDYMDARRRYESVFEKKAFGGELELGDVEAFFKECDLYPSATEMEEAMDVVLRGRGVQAGHGLKKKELLDMVYYIYVPRATGLENTRCSTWMSPIIDGVEARKLIGSELVEPAPLEPCARLVIASKRERRQREEAAAQEAAAKEEAEREAARKEALKKEAAAKKEAKKEAEQKEPAKKDSAMKDSKKKSETEKKSKSGHADRKVTVQSPRNMR